MMLNKSLIAFLVMLFSPLSMMISGWDNGLARRPPMGWLSWMRFACEIDCQTYPDECINEKLYKDMIDRLVDDGYLDAGYQYVNIDDCWMSMQRDPKTFRLLPNQTRFPSGINGLAEYAHSKNVLLGLYEDIGTLTCARYPGTYYQGKDHTYIDAETFSDWKIDSIKVDGCYADNKQFNITYVEYSKALSEVEHKILYGCSWPFFKQDFSDNDYELIRKSCNLWRQFNDIVDSYQSVKGIIDLMGKHNEQFRRYHGPGGWFDPDMLIIGNYGLSLEQSKTQMAFWCMWSAPLFMSNDLRSIRPEMKEILLNKELIAIDQDPLGIMAKKISIKSNSHQVWVKKLSKSSDHDKHHPYAILYFNSEQLGSPKYISYRLSSLIDDEATTNKTIEYDVYDLFGKTKNESYLETINSEQNLRLKVPTSGSVRIVKLLPKNI
uniref:Alpha-galactosidase n=1 Tax=Dermatophagoides pteronyssinus TaxID=6956 RepID=A0A6P6Y116_DERPT|nr:alpha-N-acetylgalactosaminidase-like isoform X1 [Dermatophagoides pteronyssinus]XP_027197984.1 alpha-N-acetylgalactosaminidase-like isoform X2 [Dermatophagoides pteronyssinus]